jgi:hypothetical protein
VRPIGGPALCVALGVLLAAVSAARAEKADFLILYRPSRHTILNRYEQELSAAERKALLPRMPLRVVEAGDRLGDQITPALRCAFQGEAHYLVRDEEGNQVTGLSAAGSRLLRRCTVLGDTVMVTSRSLDLYERHPSSGTRSTVRKGGKLFRVFSFRGATYVRVLGGQPRYGWAPGGSGSSWRTVARAPALEEQDEELTDEQTSALQERIDAANETYVTFFDAFNAKTGQQRSSPVWRRLPAGRGVGWELDGPRQYVDQLRGSTRVLVQDLRSILLGRPFSVSVDDGLITVVKR